MSTTDSNGGGSERTICFGLPFGFDIVGKVGIGNIKKIKSSQDLLSELSNLFVRMKKFRPIYTNAWSHVGAGNRT